MNNKFNKLIIVLEDFFKKAPALSPSSREMLAGNAHWYALIFGIIGVLLGAIALFGILGINFIALPAVIFGGLPDLSQYKVRFIGPLILIVQSILLLVAYKALKSRRYVGWVLLFWYVALSLIGWLLAGSIPGLILGGIIGFYLLFQIKPCFK